MLLPTGWKVLLNTVLLWQVLCQLSRCHSSSCEAITSRFSVITSVVIPSHSAHFSVIASGVPSCKVIPSRSSHFSIIASGASSYKAILSCSFHFSDITSGVPSCEPITSRCEPLLRSHFSSIQLQSNPKPLLPLLRPRFGSDQLRSDPKLLLPVLASGAPSCNAIPSCSAPPTQPLVVENFPSPPPMKLWLQKLNMTQHAKVVLKSGQWLSDSHMSATHALLRQKFPEIGGFQCTVLGSKLLFSVFECSNFELQQAQGVHFHDRLQPWAYECL